jgi:hypothetical protein
MFSRVMDTEHVQKDNEVHNDNEICIENFGWKA